MLLPLLLVAIIRQTKSSKKEELLIFGWPQRQIMNLQPANWTMKLNAKLRDHEIGVNYELLSIPPSWPPASAHEKIERLRGRERES